ncbi:MAG: YybH family protein [Betaproteobacteria bacterium]
MVDIRWIGATTSVILMAAAVALPAAQSSEREAARAAIVAADTAFSQASSDRDLARFLTFVDERAVFAGGMEGEQHGPEQVAKAWSPFFAPDGPSLTWKPDHAEVLVSGDVGYTVGTWERRVRGADAREKVAHGEYLTVWRKGADGRWRAIYDTGGERPRPPARR